MKRQVPLALLPIVAAVLTGCGQASSPRRVPDVRGQRLDLAEARLDARGLDWEEIGGGNLGIVVRSHWHVCAQEPRPGRRARTVRLIVERACATAAGRVPLVPYVVGLNLEDAADRLDAVGIEHDAASAEGDTPVVEHLWEVCDQDPAAGHRARFVELYVERDCE
jgi:hypothetical protein